MNNNPMNQALLSRQFNETHREQFNPEFFTRSDAKVIDSVTKIAYSCERDRYFTLKVLETRLITNYEEMYALLKEHEESRRRRNAPDNPYDFINIRDSDIMLLEIKFFIRHNGVERQEDDNKQTIVVTNPWEIVTVLIALPRFVRKYYFRLSGNYYETTFQIVDGSTYNNTNVGGTKNKKGGECNTFKTMFMPVRVFRGYKDLTDVTRSTIRCTVFSSIIFNNHVNVMYYLLANYGFYGALNFLDIKCIQILDTPIMDDRFYNFEKNSIDKKPIYITVPKECMKDPMVQSMVVTLYTAIDKNTEIDMMFDIKYWLQVLGKSYKNNSVDKGLFVLDSIDGIYDIITKEELHLPENCKGDIYEILRWIMREFNYLKNKENVDISIKRIRSADEYIAHVYATKLATGLHRVSDMGKRVTLKSVIRAIYTTPMFVINKIIKMSNLVGYRDLVNDNDATLALKYTYKGISGLGEDGSSVQRLYRFIDASHAGIVDLDASTESDPGMSGIICPMAKIYNGNSFSNYEEPNYWEEKFKPYQTGFFKQDKPNLKCPVDIKDREIYYRGLRDRIIEESLNIDRPKCPIYNTEDPTIEYTSAASQLNAMHNHASSLFTIKDDDTEELDDD